MGVLKKVQGGIKSLDLFAHPVGLRMNEEPEYESLTGGLLSMVMVVVFVVIFASATLNTINKVYIESKVVLEESTDPPSFQIGP